MNNNRNIAFITVKLSDGGSERVIANLASMFVNHGHKTVLVTYRRTVDEYEVDRRVKRYSLSDNANNCTGICGKISHIKQILSICKQENVDVVVGFGNGPITHAVLLKLMVGIKAVVSVRNAPDYLFTGKLTKLCVRWFYSMADGAIFQTDDAQKWFSKRLQKKSIIVFNPIGEEFFKVKYTPEPLRIVSCGRLQPQKNHKLLLDAMVIVLHSIANAKVYIYGVGPLDGKLKEYAKKKGISDSVFFEGRSSQIPIELSKASVFVLPSNVEGAPNALMEAMAVGVPSVATDCPCGGPKMLLGENTRGVIVPVGNANELAEGIIRLLTDFQKRNSYSKSSKEFSTNFSAEHVFKKWADFITHI